MLSLSHFLAKITAPGAEGKSFTSPLYHLDALGTPAFAAAQAQPRRRFICMVGA